MANEVLPNFKCVLERAVRGKTKKIFPSENVAGGASAKKKILLLPLNKFLLPSCNFHAHKIKN